MSSTFAVTIHGYPSDELARTMIGDALAVSTTAFTVTPLDDAPQVLDLYGRINDLTVQLAASAQREHRAETELSDTLKALDRLNEDVQRHQRDADDVRQQRQAALNEQDALRTELEIAQQDLAALRIKVTNKDHDIMTGNNRMQSLLNFLRDYCIDQGFEADDEFVRTLVDEYDMPPLTQEMHGEFTVTYTVAFSATNVPADWTFDDLTEAISEQMNLPDLRINDLTVEFDGKRDRGRLRTEVEFDRAYGGDAEDRDWTER